MTPTPKSDFLKIVRSALGHRSDVDRTPPPDLFPDAPSRQSRLLLGRVRGRRRTDRLVLLETLKAAAASIHLEVLTPAADADAVAHIVDIASNAAPEWGGSQKVCVWRHPLIERLDLAAALAPLGIPVIGAGEDPGGTVGREVRDCYIGLTAADHCVAETATLVLRTRPGQPRSHSLVPSIHVALIRLGQLLADFSELYAVLRWQESDGGLDLGNCLTFISGPSKTADIEATLVHGAHGPRALYLIVLPE